MSEHEAHAHDEHADGPYGADEVHAHVGSYRGYITVFVALICLTLLTFGVAGIHLGRANLAVAVLIASAKASLVCTFFMHLKDDNRFNTLILISAITFIGVFFALTLNDVNYREGLDTQSGNTVFLPTGDEAPGSWVNPIKREEPATSESSESSSTESAPTAAPAAPAPAAPAASASAALAASAAPAVSATAAAHPSAKPAHSAAPAHAASAAHVHTTAPAPRASASAAH